VPVAPMMAMSGSLGGFRVMLLNVCSTLKVRSHCSQMTVMALLNAENLANQVALLSWMDQALLLAYAESKRVARRALIASLNFGWVGTLQCVAWIGHTHFRNRVACQ